MVFVIGEKYKNGVKLCILEKRKKVWYLGKQKFVVKPYTPYFMDLELKKGINKFIFRSHKCIKMITLRNRYETAWVVCCNNKYTFTECSIWSEIYKDRRDVIFHLGDQIYADRIYYRWKDFLKKLPEHNWNKYKINIKKEYVREYIETWEPIECILSNSFNIMIPDDHEMKDQANIWETSTKTKTCRLDKFLFETALSVAKKIYLGMRYTNKFTFDYFRNLGNTTIIMHERVSQPFMSNDHIQRVVNYKKKMKDNVLWLGAIPPVKIAPNFWEMLFYNYDSDDPVEKYDILYSLYNDPNKNVIFIGGDLHIGSVGTITSRDKNRVIAKYHIVGPASGFCSGHIPKDSLQSSKTAKVNVKCYRPRDTNAVKVDLKKFKSQHIFKRYSLMEAFQNVLYTAYCFWS